jgi:glycerol-3-phosphate dehydrogenase
LVERGDFASGTSSKSSKLVHGGLRYLQQREFGLVHESLRERQRLLENAPHLVTPLPFLIPLFGKGGVLDKGLVRSFGIALTLYDLTGGWRIGKSHQRVGAAVVSLHLPTLRTERLVSGFIYYDARTDDARLTLAIARTAVLDHGAVAANYAPVTGLVRDGSGRIRGATVAPADRPQMEVRARSVVNATGVWADEVRALDESRHPHSLRPAKGIHLAVPQRKLPCDIAAVIPVRKDGRSIFVIPWGDQAYLGTTDSDYDGPLDDPRVEESDVTYILDAVNAVVVDPITPADVTGTWAGLRPLLTDVGRRRPASARTADLSRRHQVSHSPSGLVTITGGKLTTYRKMAEDTVDEVARILVAQDISQDGTGTRAAEGPAGPAAAASRRRSALAGVRGNAKSALGRSRTARLRLRGADGTEKLRARAAEASRELGVDEPTLANLVGRYGGETRAVLALASERPELLQPIGEGLPHLAAEVVYAARYEMAKSVEDVLARRTRALLRDAPAARLVARCTAELLATELGWSAARVEEEIEAFTKIVERDTAAPAALAGREIAGERERT